MWVGVYIHIHNIYQYPSPMDGKKRPKTCLEDGEVDGVANGEGALLGVPAEQRDVLLARRQGLL